MGDRLRVFLVARTAGDLDSLTADIERRDLFEIVGRALIDRVQRGEVTVPVDVEVVLASPRALGRVASAPTAPSAELVEQLTPRELDVLALVADGLPNREIARELEISEHTVKFHLAAAFGKLGASSRTEAVRRGLQLGLIEI